MSSDLIVRYYGAFNAGDLDGMAACVSEDLAHHVNEGQVRRGRAAFVAFNAHMARCYREELRDLAVLSGPPGRFAAEFTVHGTYLRTDDGLPEARGQSYVLPAGAFLTVAEGEITRIVTYYNLADWLRQVA
ncbi:hypothetical protein JANAI62_35600 [Jannaschia pagri]|uniref:SnoaL-like domain-containing protein n=1 Tax=Jannaschia pagri TaxID=2829797 RepID=A0ABQ4NR89_9RHOB|nr:MULTISPECIES: nuclear transport factor 2 family protein [unclassified Jannaschia]GIT93156.1 hypothetical protein JANAI61_36140 [Jannaschia sp. AI_61]GIT96937.1 hypothetical protein JANAI62_35600 [Jannaschia sp. AI_62]